MNRPDSTESSHIRPVGNSVPNPAYPTPPGGGIPDLNLAGWPQQGASIQVMPDPGKPAPADYSLVGSPECGGYDPSNPAPPAPNLACVEGWPSPQSLMSDSRNLPVGAATGRPILPDYGMPNMAEPTLQTANLANDGISFDPRTEWQPDLAHPDLTSYNHPMGLTFHNNSLGDLFKPDPVLADLTNPDIPNGIRTVSHPLAPDPDVPDLQNPQLTPDVHMRGRPGDLDISALGTMDADPSVQQASSVPYAQSHMDASGMNNRRRRHMDLLTHGLED